MTDSAPAIEVEKDYDGYFERLVRSWVEGKTTPFKSERIVISSGPYRPYAVTTSRKGNTLYIDFYSAIRVGFGELSEAEVDQIIELWL